MGGTLNLRVVTSEECKTRSISDEVIQAHDAKFAGSNPSLPSVSTFNGNVYKEAIMIHILIGHRSTPTQTNEYMENQVHNPL